MYNRNGNVKKPNFCITGGKKQSQYWCNFFWRWPKSPMMQLYIAKNVMWNKFSMRARRQLPTCTSPPLCASGPFAMIWHRRPSELHGWQKEANGIDHHREVKNAWDVATNQNELPPPLPPAEDEASSLFVSLIVPYLTSSCAVVVHMYPIFQFLMMCNLYTTSFGCPIINHLWEMFLFIWSQKKKKNGMWVSTKFFRCAHPQVYF
jgi:hypothetical protein